MALVLNERFQPGLVIFLSMVLSPCGHSRAVVMTGYIKAHAKFLY
jgi:hypothetical protein